ncbi:MAG: DNA topoisomerase (ATP-hydrolyzing) subunit A [Christensenellales bacterium]
MENFDDENKIPGQMCYDELETTNQEEPEVTNDVVEGQISLDDLDTNNIERGNKKAMSKDENQEILDEANGKNVMSEENNSKSVLDEIEADKQISEPKNNVRKERAKQIKLDLSEADGSGIILTTLEAVLHNSMIPYTEHVVLDRALPRVEDGLKPVQRRILYTMLELGLQPDKQFRKSARIVGDCMGKYHPHGDSSVYDAMVRMAQPYLLREPLVLGHGNFGSIDGDSAAAMRYTEAKLTPLAMELLRDLDKNTIRWMLNFDDTLKEPTMLPGRFPNLLVNGAYGIAVGVATNIPPHNLSEVIEGVIAYIDNPKISLDEMMKIIKGPDFPTGGIIIAGDELKEAYRTGKGKIIIRAKTHIEEKGDKKSIVITEVPYQTNKAAILQKIAELREENKNILSGIVEIRDESDRTGMRAVIRLKKEANENYILEHLFKQTQLQVTFGINMVAIAGGKPRQMGLMEIISYYVEYQREIIFRRTKFELDQAKDRAHILEGLLIAIKNIDEVIKIIKTSASVSEAKLRLRSKFVLSEKQAQAILDMRLARLVNLEVNKLKEELAELKIRIAELTKIYESKRLQLQVVKTELGEIKRKFKNPRKSTFDKKLQIEEVKTKVKSEPIIMESEVILGVTASGNIKSIPLKNYTLAQKEVSETTTIEHIHTQLLKVKNTQKVLIFTNKGNCYKTVAGNIPESKWKEKGNLLKTVDKKIASDEKVIKLFVLPEKFDDKELIFFTTDGMVKRSKFEEYDIAKAYFQAIKLKEGEEVVDVQEYQEKGSVLFVSKQSMVLNFEKTDIPVQGRVSGGVKGMNLDQGDSVLYATQVDKSGFLTILTDKGVGKRISVAEFGLSARYRKGLRSISLGGKGKLIYAEFDYEKPSIAVSSNDKFKQLSEVPILSRISDGKQLVTGKIAGAYKYSI